METKDYRDMFSKLHTSINEEDIIMHRKQNGKPRAFALLLAAALALALAVSAAAIYRGRLQDLVLRGAETPEAADAAQAAPDSPAAEPRSQTYDPLEKGKDTISLQGYAGSPEYRAALAWAEFLHGYDRDGAELKKVGNRPTGFEEKYSFNGYHVYTQAMADKIDELAGQYGLALHTGGIQAATEEELEARFGDFLSVRRWSGYYYEDGTFQCDCEAGGAAFQLRRCVKGTLDTVLLNVADAEQFEQWEYETACGKTVLLALGPEKALILADLEGSFVTVNVLAGKQSPDPFTAARLEALADSVDFSIL